MSSDIFKMISKQTGVDDLLHIEKIYYECNKDEVATIFKLMGIAMPNIRGEKLVHEQTVFDDLRVICDEKDTIFQRMKST